MSVNAISSISSASSTSSTSSSSALTETTKKKLEALGVDTSQIKTETEGLQKLKEAQASQAAQTAQSAQGEQEQNGASSELDIVKEEAKTLASKIGVDVSDQDKLDDILTNIGTKLTAMSIESSNEPQKLQELKEYESQFAMISSEYINIQTQQQQQQSQLTNSLNSLSSYNKIYFNL